MSGKERGFGSKEAGRIFNVFMSQISRQARKFNRVKFLRRAQGSPFPRRSIFRRKVERYARARIGGRINTGESGERERLKSDNNEVLLLYDQ